MRTFVIADSSRRKAKPVGVLFWHGDPEGGQGSFSLELSSTCHESDLPLSLAFCMNRDGRCATHEESEDWVRSRIVPESRHNIVEVLRSNGLAEYDEVSLFASSKGRSSDDDFLAYEVDLPEQLARALSDADGMRAAARQPIGDAGLLACSRADRVLSTVRRNRGGHEVRYAFVELPGSIEPNAADSAGVANAGHSDDGPISFGGTDQVAAKRIGAQIRRQRCESGLTQKQLAASAGITQAVLSRVESGAGNPTLALLEEIAAALGMRLDVSLF